MDQFTQSLQEPPDNHHQRTVADVMEILRIIDIANGRFGDGSINPAALRGPANHERTDRMHSEGA